MRLLSLLSLLTPSTRKVINDPKTISIEHLAEFSDRFGLDCEEE